MNKISEVTNIENVYDVCILINNTALVNSTINGKSGLININDNEIVGSFDSFHTIYDQENKFYIQEKEIEGNEYNFVRIYDALNEKMIVDNCLFISKKLKIIKNPRTSKYYLFDNWLYRKSPDIFEREFDNIEPLSNYPYENKVIVTLNNKKGIYQIGKGFITEIEYDDIEKVRDCIIYSKNARKYFYMSDLDLKSQMYIDIKKDEKIPNLLYCYKEHEIEVFHIEKGRVLFKMPLYDEVKCLTSLGWDNDYAFMVKKNDKYGIVWGAFRLHESDCKTTQVVKSEYDKIEYNANRGVFYLYKEDKVGLFEFSDNCRHNVKIEALYDKIISFGEQVRYYILHNNEHATIIKFDKDTWSKKIIVNNCRIIDVVDDYQTIFELISNSNNRKNGDCGLLIPSYKGEVLIDGYDDIKHLGNDFFEIKKNGLKGLFMDNKVLIEPFCKNISLHGVDKYSKLSSDTIYISLQKSDGKYVLGRIIRNSNEEPKLEILHNFEYDDIQFLDDIIVLKTNSCTYVYNYKNTGLRVLNGDIKIEKIQLNESKRYGTNSFYLVNGNYYYFKDNKFFEIMPEECELYTTQYEHEYGTILVSECDKEKHDKACSMIEEMSEEEVSKTLIKLYDKNKGRINEKYPNFKKSQ